MLFICPSRREASDGPPPPPDDDVGPPPLAGIYPPIAASLQFELPFKLEKDDTNLFTWGKVGKLGHRETKNEVVPRKLGVFEKKRVVKVAAAHSHSMTLTHDGRVFVWGTGPLGIGEKRNQSPTPYMLLPLRDIIVVQIACSKNHSLALSDTRDVYAWGDPEVTGHTRLVWEPTLLNVTKDKSIMQIACCDNHSAGFSENGALYTWGRRGPWLGLGESLDTLGDGTQAQFGQVDAMNGFMLLQVACGMLHTMVLCQSGEVFTFGVGKNGRLGHGDEADVWSPLIVEGLQTVPIGYIAAGYEHCAAVSLKQGQLYTWGCNRDYRLGHPNATVDYATPTLVQSLSTTFVCRVACGEKQSGAIAHNGAIILWGLDIHGHAQDVPHVIEFLQGFPRIYDLAFGPDFQMVVTTHIDENTRANPAIKLRQSILQARLASGVAVTTEEDERDKRRAAKAAATAGGGGGGALMGGPPPSAAPPRPPGKAPDFDAPPPPSSFAPPPPSSRAPAPPTAAAPPIPADIDIPAMPFKSAPRPSLTPANVSAALANVSISGGSGSTSSPTSPTLASPQRRLSTEGDASPLSPLSAATSPSSAAGSVKRDSDGAGLVKKPVALFEKPVNQFATDLTPPKPKSVAVGAAAGPKSGQKVERPPLKGPGFKLLVVMEGTGDILGSVEVGREDKLDNLRLIVMADLKHEAAQQDFFFLMNGQPVARRQESKRSARDFLPSIQIKIPVAPVGSAAAAQQAAAAAAEAGGAGEKLSMQQALKEAMARAKEAAANPKKH